MTNTRGPSSPRDSRPPPPASSVGAFPVGDDRTRVVAELREIATIRPKPRRGTPHQPPAMVREELLAEAAGLLLGTASPTQPQAHRAAAELLIEVGADRSLLDCWTNVGLTRAAGAEYVLMDPAPGTRWP